MAAALLLSVSFTSCDELGLFDNDNEASDNQAFYPKAYEGKKVAAWYSLSEEEKGGGKRIEAVFLFEDNSFVVTKNRFYPDDRKSERTITAEGEYELEGDYDNGTAVVMINGEPEPMTVEIVNGVMKAMREEFTKQNNKKLPKASDPTGEGGDGEGGQGGGDDNGIEAFFPNGYSNKDVASWYAQSGTVSEQGYEMQYNAAIFFFENGQFVATAHTVITGPDGPIPTKTIAIKGHYEFKEGDFNTGKLKLTGDDGKEMIVDIADGKLSGIETEDGKVVIYAKQDTKSVPQPSEPTDFEAFFPTTYIDKTVAAWYSLSEEEKGGGKRIEAVFLFEDNSFVVTKNRFYPDDRKSERTITAEGEYELEGDYDNGTAVVMINGAHERMSVEIVDGIMKSMGSEFTKQDNKKVPKASSETSQGGESDGGEGGDGGEGEGGEGEGGEGGQGEGGEDQGDEVPAFFPKAYADKTVVAWYSFTEGEPAETRVEAVFLFEDYEIIVTENKVFGEGVGMNPERYIKSVGSYKLEGDFETGRGIVELSDLGQLEVKIEEGVLTVQYMYGEYIKRALADIPDPLDPTDQGQQGQQGGEGEGGQGGEDQGGEGEGGEGGEVQYNGDPTPYLPAQYGSKTIAAWYQYDNVGNGTITYECVFLFTDKTLVVTKSKFYNIGDGRGPEYKINAQGQYSMSEDGDFENGTASVVTADGMTMEVRIENGILYAMNTEFTKQDNKDAPTPIKK